MSRKACILPVFLFALLHLGCEKDKGGETVKEGTFTCKINGELFEFNALVNANDRPAEEAVHFVVLSGYERDALSSPFFGIDLLVPGDGATAKTYTTADSELRGQYCIQHVKDGKIEYTTCHTGNGSNGSSFTLNITSLDDWGVKGTFSGLLKVEGENAYLTVTDGQFSAPYGFMAPIGM